MQRKIQFNRNPFISKRFRNVKDWVIQKSFQQDIMQCDIISRTLYLHIKQTSISQERSEVQKSCKCQSLTFQNLFEMKGFLLN